MLKGVWTAPTVRLRRPLLPASRVARCRRRSAREALPEVFFSGSSDAAIATAGRTPTTTSPGSSRSTRCARSSTASASTPQWPDAGSLRDPARHRCPTHRGGRLGTRCDEAGQRRPRAVPPTGSGWWWRLGRRSAARRASGHRPPRYDELIIGRTSGPGSVPCGRAQGSASSGATSRPRAARRAAWASASTRSSSPAPRTSRRPTAVGEEVVPLLVHGHDARRACRRSPLRPAEQFSRQPQIPHCPRIRARTMTITEASKSRGRGVRHGDHRRQLRLPRLSGDGHAHRERRRRVRQRVPARTRSISSSTIRPVSQSIEPCTRSSFASTAPCTKVSTRCVRHAALPRRSSPAPTTSPPSMHVHFAVPGRRGREPSALAIRTCRSSGTRSSTSFPSTSITTRTKPTSSWACYVT